MSSVLLKIFDEYRPLSLGLEDRQLVFLLTSCQLFVAWMLALGLQKSANETTADQSQANKSSL